MNTITVPLNRRLRRGWAEQDWARRAGVRLVPARYGPARCAVPRQASTRHGKGAAPQSAAHHLNTEIVHAS